MSTLRVDRDRLAKQLRRLAPRGRILTSPAQLAGYDADGLGYKAYRPDVVAIPADADELIAVLQSAKELDAPVCLRGAGTSLSGGPVAAQGGVVVHTSNLRKIRQIDADGFWCEVECGVALNQLDTELAPYGLFYPPDPSSGPVCTLGGNVAMNAGGAHCFRYGVTSNYVLGVEAVTADGGVHRFGGPAGGRGDWREDWKRLMVGSEGTLAAFTRFWLRLSPRPEKVWTFRATYADLVSAERAIHALTDDPSFPAAIELMDPRCVAMVENSPMAAGLPKDAFMILTEIDGPRELVDRRVDAVARLLREAGSDDVVFSDDDQQRRKLWKARKAAGGLVGQISPDFLVQDAVIPKRALAELLQRIYDDADEAGIPVMNVFHAGDGNLLPNFLFDSRIEGQLETVERLSKQLMLQVVELGGTLSGEHGIGNDKSAYTPLVFGPDAMRLQLAVTTAFDPQRQLNPLKVFTARRFGEAKHEQPAPPALASPTDAERCFQPFIDPIDGVMCVSAAATDAEVQDAALRHGLRFPLRFAADATLRQQVAASSVAPASSRFGPFCDNILGMNWRLPNGRLVRIGERVVKSTTGYDLLRFLLHGQTRPSFGEPVDFVLRLRPERGFTGVAKLTGEAVEQAAKSLLKTCWLHWFDSLDVLVDATETPQLRICAKGAVEEWPIYEAVLRSTAREHALEFTAETEISAAEDGCPDFVFKTTPDRVVGLARELADQEQIHCVALCYSGVVHGYLRDEPAPATRIQHLVERYQTQLYEVGGDWFSRRVGGAAPVEAETAWREVLHKEFAL